MSDVLELRGVSAGYGRADALRNISITLRAGEITSVIGPNGSGKTTFARVAARLLSARAGTVLVCGRPLREISRRDAAKLIAYLPQSFELPDIPFREAVKLGREPFGGSDGGTVVRAIELSGGAELAERRVSRLSGGERRRCAVAMFLAQALDERVRLAVMDEPAENLDPSGRREIAEIARILRREGKCVAAIQHDLTGAFASADRIAVLRAGELLFDGAPDDAAGQVAELFGVRSAVIDGSRVFW